MSRGNMFQNEANKIINASYDEVKEMAIDQIAVIYSVLSNGDFINGDFINIITISAMIGFMDDGHVSPQEERFFTDLMDTILEGSEISIDIKALCQSFNKTPVQKAKEAVEVFENLLQVPALALACFRLILCFAYIDKKFEDSFAAKVESTFGIVLMADFFASGQESVPAPTRKVRLTDTQISIVSYLRKKNTIVPLEQICDDLSLYEKSAKRALDKLVEYGVCYGGEQIINCMYALTDDYTNYIDINQITDKENEKNEAYYQDAIGFIDIADQENDIKYAESTYNNAIQNFRRIGNYKDSYKKISECNSKIAELPKRGSYNEAVSLFSNAKSEQDISAAKAKFEELKGYKDSEKYIEECRVGSEKLEEYFRKYPLLNEKDHYLSDYNRIKTELDNVKKKDFSTKQFIILICAFIAGIAYFITPMIKGLSDYDNWSDIWAYITFSHKYRFLFVIVCILLFIADIIIINIRKKSIMKFENDLSEIQTKLNEIDNCPTFNDFLKNDSENKQ